MMIQGKVYVLDRIIQQMHLPLEKKDSNSLVQSLF